MANNRHYHVMGVCREHGPVTLEVTRTLDETREYIFAYPAKMAELKGVTITETGRTKNIIEFEQTDLRGGFHDQFVSFATHDTEEDTLEQCRAMMMMEHLIETMARAAAAMESDVPAPSPEPVDD